MNEVNFLQNGLFFYVVSVSARAEQDRIVEVALDSKYKFSREEDRKVQNL